ncbi:MAG: hypothetical protein Q9213_006726 [Squamulea squamosa]
MANNERNFHHPFIPYDIQSQLMTAVYDCIAEGKVGIFESPTGTGKSLSLICSTLSWLRDEQKAALDVQLCAEEDDKEPAWILEQSRKQKTEQLMQRRLELESRLATIREKELRQRQPYEKGEPQRKRAKVDYTNPSSKLGDEDQFLLDDYKSEGESTGSTVVRGDREGLSNASLDLIRKLGEPVGTTQDDSEVEAADELKIFYCSRTHSQITQFISELRKVDIPQPLWLHDQGKSPAGNVRQETKIKHVPLGSRRNLCINPTVVNAGSTTAINERCLDLQQPTIVTLPYQLLLHKSSREALGISIKGHVIVIDEAHNIMDAITNIHSITVTQSQLHRCCTQLRTYLQKFRNRLKGKNRVFVTQTVRLIDSVSECLDKWAIQSSEKEALVTVGQMMSGKSVDQINLYKLMRYLGDSKLARKVEGYVEHARNQASSAPASLVDTTPVLSHIQGFLQALTNPAAEGRFFFERDESSSVSIKYLLLDPTFHFRDVVEEARAIIMAGGTMSPMDDYARHLFPYVTTERLKTWSCGHIIPKDNLFVRSVSRIDNGVDLDFSFTKRNSIPLINALGFCLVRLAAVVPDGLVVFFPSYAYLDQVSVQWQDSTSGSESIWTILEKRKLVFKESKGSSGIEDTLQRYSKTIYEGKGAILLSVVGGKMSEGINFSDKLGRGVAIVGLPFPNLHSAQWKAKLDYIEQSIIGQGRSSAEGKAAGRDFYENACMRAVNQSIGRAIRHQKDFASILLLDRRYATPRIVNKLPGWIKQGLDDNDAAATFPEIIQGLEHFFEAKG